MPKQSFEAVLKQLQDKAYQPVYFFQGDEGYYIDTLLKEIETNTLPEAQQAFNQTVVYGKDVSTETGKIIDLCMRLPMMADRQVVIVKEAQNITNWAPIEKYILNPTPTTILAFGHKNGKIDGRKAISKMLAKNTVLVTANAIKDYDAPKFIQSYVTSKNYTIDNKSAQLLVEFLGTDVAKIVNELEKLFLVLDDTKITPEAIEENIGISKDFNVFELQKAILKKDKAKVFLIADYFGRNPKAGHIIQVIANLYYLFSKLFLLQFAQGKSKGEIASLIKVSPYFVNDYTSAMSKFSPQAIQQSFYILNEYDLKAKGVGNVSNSNEELMKEMLFKLLMA